MADKDQTPPRAEPLLTVTADGQVIIGLGYTVGQALEAAELVRRMVLGLVLRPQPPEAAK